MANERQSKTYGIERHSFVIKERELSVIAFNDQHVSSLNENQFLWKNTVTISSYDLGWGRRAAIKGTLSVVLTIDWFPCGGIK